MNLISLLALCLTALAGVNAFTARNPRDVSQLSADNSAQIYLPPSAQNQAELPSDTDDEATEKSLSANDVTEAKTQEAASTAENKDNDTVLKPEGYVYKTVRRLRLRSRRDVSHLNREYLPPAVRVPATHYLPPVENVRKAPELSNEYLPPVEPETEAPTTEAPITTTTTMVAITTTTEAITEQPTTQALITKELIDDSAVLSDDGYHYKKPDVVPDLSPVREYLPPLDDDSVVVDDIPANNESAALAEDGYRYRAIRRFRF